MPATNTRTQKPQRSRNGAPKAEESPYTENVINIDRVSRVVKGGRRFRFRALVVVGDGKTQVGIGVSKGADVQTAVQKAVDVAKKNFVTIPVENQSIPHDTDAKVAGAHVSLMPARTGSGVIAGGTVRAVLEVTGIENILSKSRGSSNKINVAYATLEALTKLKPKSEWPSVKSVAKKDKKAKES